jgi:CheY-like chemotaxis protein
MRPPSDSSGLTVLLVDDNRINRRLGSLMLKRLGCTVTSVGDAPAAIDEAAREPFDLVLMDLSMPGIDGLEAARRIRAGGARMPILAVTANALEDDRAACTDAGMDGLLVKPLRLEQLRGLVAGIDAAAR